MLCGVPICPQASETFHLAETPVPPIKVAAVLSILSFKVMFVFPWLVKLSPFETAVPPSPSKGSSVQLFVVPYIARAPVLAKLLIVHPSLSASTMPLLQLSPLGVQLASTFSLIDRLTVASMDAIVLINGTKIFGAFTPVMEVNLDLSNNVLNNAQSHPCSQNRKN